MSIQIFYFAWLVIAIIAVWLAIKLAGNGKWKASFAVVVVAVFGPAFMPVKFHNPGGQVFVRGEIQRFDNMPPRVEAIQDKYQDRMDKKHEELRESSKQLINKTLER